MGPLMSNQYFCTSCGEVGKPRVRNRGSSAIELILWFLLIVPGLCYTLWRMGRKDRYCRSCTAPNPIPANSPMAQRYLGGGQPAPPQFQPTQAPRQGFGYRA